MKSNLKLIVATLLTFILIAAFVTSSFAAVTEDGTYKDTTITVTNGYGLLAKTGYKVSGLNTEAKIVIDTTINCFTHEQVVDIIKKSKNCLNSGYYNTLVESSSYKKGSASAGLFCGFLGLGASASGGSSSYYRNTSGKSFVVNTSNESSLMKNIVDETYQQHRLHGEFTVKQNSIVPSEASLYLELTRIKFTNTVTGETTSKLAVSTGNTVSVDDTGKTNTIVDGSLILDGDPLNE